MSFFALLFLLPILTLWYGAILAFRSAKVIPRWVLWTMGVLPLPFLGLIAYAEGRYIVLEEGIVMDACDGNADGIRWRLGLGADANARTDDRLGALECAATNGHVEAARVLLEHGADPDGKGNPRAWAVKGEDPEMLRLFAKYPKQSPSPSL